MRYPASDLKAGPLEGGRLQWNDTALRTAIIFIIVALFGLSSDAMSKPKFG